MIHDALVAPGHDGDAVLLVVDEVAELHRVSLPIWLSPFGLTITIPDGCGGTEGPEPDPTAERYGLTIAVGSSGERPGSG